MVRYRKRITASVQPTSPPVKVRMGEGIKLTTISSATLVTVRRAMPDKVVNTPSLLRWRDRRETKKSLERLGASKYHKNEECINVARETDRQEQ